MNFKKAIDAMNKGHKVKRNRWLKGDFICLLKGRIICDGGYDFLLYLTSADFKANDWEIVGG